MCARVVDARALVSDGSVAVGADGHFRQRDGGIPGENVLQQLLLDVAVLLHLIQQRFLLLQSRVRQADIACLDDGITAQLVDEELRFVDGLDVLQDVLDRQLLVRRLLAFLQLHDGVLDLLDVLLDVAQVGLNAVFFRRQLLALDDLLSLLDDRQIPAELFTLLQQSLQLPFEFDDSLLASRRLAHRSLQRVPLDARLTGMERLVAWLGWNPPLRLRAERVLVRLAQRRNLLRLPLQDLILGGHRALQRLDHAALLSRLLPQLRNLPHPTSVLSFVPIVLLRHFAHQLDFDLLQLRQLLPDALELIVLRLQLALLSQMFLLRGLELSQLLLHVRQLSLVLIADFLHLAGLIGGWSFYKTREREKTKVFLEPSEPSVGIAFTYVPCWPALGRAPSACW